ncbi:Lectin [Merluccius polli]|uniref:Lectin n=1 Tax=Merluccius polli TaxID=89951 RepID=A0AA47MI17_MERPO|nr:Lectin [Merluccius polli]
MKTGDMRQEAGDRRHEDRRQETRDETGERRQETGERRQETGDRREETGDRRQEVSRSAAGIVDKMLRIAVICLLALSGLRAAPLQPRGGPADSPAGGLGPGVEPAPRLLPQDFQQGTEPRRRFLVDLDTGLVKEHVSEMQRRADPVSTGSASGDMERHWLDKVEVPVQRSAAGWVRVEEYSEDQLPEGFRQGIEPMMSIPDGFRQGTEPLMSIPDGFRQGTEPIIISIPDGLRRGNEPMSSIQGTELMSIPDGFRQGTEPIMTIPDGFRQGTEPMMSIPEGFRQGIEPMMSIPDGFRQGTEPLMSIPDGFRQGTEPIIISIPVGLRNEPMSSIQGTELMSIPDGFRQGTEPMMTIPDGFRQGTEPMMSIPEGFRQRIEPMMFIPDGFRQGTEPLMSIPDGFRQGTEPIIISIPVGLRNEPMSSIQGTELMSIPDGFRQGTEPMMTIPDGFRQGTEPMMSIPEGFRQGTEPMMSIPDGFRQGTEPLMSIPDGFRQGTEPIIISIPVGLRQGNEPMSSIQGTELVSIPDGFRQGTEPMMSIPDGFRQGTEPSTFGRGTHQLVCEGKVINGRCYQFNAQPLSFRDAQAACGGLAPGAHLASVTDEGLHAALVSMVTKDGEASPVLTWLGGVVKAQQAQWLDGSEWVYSDWMPGFPKLRSVKPVCLQMFWLDQTWWTTVDCELPRASVCSFPLATWSVPAIQTTQ